MASEGSVPRSFLVYRRLRYLRLSVLALAVAVAAYIFNDPVGGRSGGSWLGYSLGSVCAFLVLWLMWFGIRRRRYVVRGAPLRGWLSAHVYMGLTLVLLVPLHSAFQFGWNLHTLAYVLICMVVASGLAGIWLYSVMPDRISRNRKGTSVDRFFEEIDDLNRQAVSMAEGLPDLYSRAVHNSLSDIRIGGSIWRQLSGVDPGCETQRALDAIGGFERGMDAEAFSALSSLREILATKRALLTRLRRDVRLNAMTEVWLAAHIPLSVAGIAAVLVHVFVVFYYW